MLKVLVFGRKNITLNVLKYLKESKKFNIVGVIIDESLQISKVINSLDIQIFNEQSLSKALKEKKLSFDLGLSILYWKKIKKSTIEASKIGIINFHPAPLPEYKGTAGYNLAILESLNEWAVSSHFIDESIDTGPIISVKNFRICPNNETVSSIEKKSLIKMEKQVFEVLEMVLTNKIKLIKNLGGRYVSRKQMEDMKEIKEGDDVDRKIRAFWYPPYDGAYVKIKNKKYTLINRELLKKLPTNVTDTIFTPKKS